MTQFDVKDLDPKATQYLGKPSSSASRPLTFARLITEAGEQIYRDFISDPEVLRWVDLCGGPGNILLALEKEGLSVEPIMSFLARWADELQAQEQK